MPLPKYMTAKGTKQGDIKGSSPVAQDAYKDMMLIYEIRHKVHIESDPDHGHASARRRHEILEVEMPVNRATPLLFQALCTGETLSEVKIIFPEINEGVERIYFTITLTNATVVDLTLVGENTLNADFSHRPDVHSVGFRYQKIQWENLPFKTMAVDDWQKAGQ